ACSPEDNGGPPVVYGDPQRGDSRGGDLAGDHPDTCGPRPDTCLVHSWIRTVTGAVVDESGAPLVGAMAQLCVRKAVSEALVCVSPVATDASGSFVVAVPTTAQCMQHAVMRVLMPAADRAVAYCPVLLPTSVCSLVLAEPFILHATTPASTLPPPGDGTQELTVIFDDGLEIDVTPNRIPFIDYDSLAARRLSPDAAGLCFLEDAGSLEAVYAFSPDGEATGTPFALRIPNATSLPAHTAVDLYVLGGLSYTLGNGSHVEEGDWVQYGTATVSSDGNTIEGDGIPFLTWLGYAPH
ncbi:hypothetical protein ACFL6C_14395, partial [Myxococcota bacterium]